MALKTISTCVQRVETRCYHIDRALGSLRKFLNRNQGINQSIFVIIHGFHWTAGSNVMMGNVQFAVTICDHNLEHIHQ